MRNFKTSILTLVCVSFVTANAFAARSKDNDGLVEKLPAKAATKRTYVDFSNEDKAVVVAPRAADLDRVLKTSDRDVKSAKTASNSSISTPTQSTTVRSRKIMAAPEGDSAEPMSAMATATPAPVVRAKTETKTTANVAAKTAATPAPVATPALVSTQISAGPPSTTPTASPMTSKLTPTASESLAPLSVQKIEPVFVGPVAPPTPVRPPIPYEPIEEFNETAKVPRAVARPLPPVDPVPEVEVVTATKANEKEVAFTNETRERSEIRLPRRELGDGFFKAIDAKSMVFIRAGYFSANYKKFDDRMSNGASSMGIAAARGLETSWGEFEVRAAFDVYHPMDQSVSIDNLRMFNARTEVAYWLSHSRVKPGLSLGLGMADYSIRSYRSVSDTNESEVVLKTHAKSKAFSLIPATSLRVELAKELVIDAQTEFMALLGGDNADAAQGLGVNVSLGWMF